MKKIFFTLTIIFLSNTFYAQNSLEKYDNKDDVSSIIVTKKMFDLMSKVQVDASDKQTQSYLNVTKKLDDLIVFTTQNTSVVNEMKATTENYVKTTNLNVFKKIVDGSKNATIYTNAGATATQVTELFMFIESPSSEESVLMDLKGKFSLSEVSLLIDKMQIPGGNYIKQAANN